MAEWRAGRSVGRTLYVDGRLVGLVDTAELAAEIVETMNRVGRLLDEVRPVERSRRHAARCPACDSRTCCPHCQGDHAAAAPGAPPLDPGAALPMDYCGVLAEHVGHWHSAGALWCPGIVAVASHLDAQRRSEATPQKDLQTEAITFTEHDRIAAQLARVDPYDTKKGYTP